MTRERSAVLAFALALVVATSAPPAYGYLTTPPGLRFMGLHVLNSGDTYTYLALMEQGREGHVLFRNLYTHEPQHAFAVRPVYLAGGWLSRLLRIPNDVTFLLMKAFAVFLFVLALHAFSRRFFARPRDRLVFLVVTCLASGLGWLVGASLPRSVDLWMPETVTFMSLYEAPHFTVALILLLAVLAFVGDALGDTLVPFRRSSAVLAFAATLLLSLEHPYDLFSLGPVLLALLIVRWRLGRTLPREARVTLGLVLAGAFLGLGYQALALRLEPVYAVLERQGVVLSESPLTYISGYGVLLPLAVAGAWIARRERPTPLLAVAAFLPLLVAYAPLKFQRRVVEGAQVSLAVLATMALAAWLDRPEEPARRRLRRVGLAALLLVLPLSNLRLVAEDLGAFSRHASPYHMPVEIESGLVWLRDHTGEDSLVLADWHMGNLIPGVSGRRVFVGSEYWTADFREKAGAADRFLRAGGEPPGPIDYVVTGSFVEGAGRSPWIDLSKAYERVYANAQVAIYRVSGRAGVERR